MTQNFKINDKITIECRTYETRYSWGHYADLYINGSYIGEKKATYYNRTWESYTFQSVLYQVVEKFSKHFTKTEIEECNAFIKSGKRVDEDPAMGHLKAVSAIASLGDLFGQTQKESNDWKARMLKAGLENRGLEMPKDWDELSENEKEERLNGAIAQLK